MTHRGPIQPLIFCDSVVVWNLVRLQTSKVRFFLQNENEKKQKKAQKKGWEWKRDPGLAARFGSVKSRSAGFHMPSGIFGGHSSLAVKQGGNIAWA